MRLYGIRGATTVAENSKESIIEETQKLLREIIAENNLTEEQMVSIIFTSTPDLTAEFPAKACRLMGLTNIPLLGAVEADIDHGLLKCIRVLIHAYPKDGSNIRHIYLNEAVRLRPDLVGKEPCPIQIAIDGPAGAGKSTVAKLLADKLGYLYIDTGAMYRTITYLAIQKGMPCTDEEALTELAAEADIKFARNSAGRQLIICDGIDVTEEIRTPEISNKVSLTAKHEGVRRELVKKQQDMSKSHNVVMDGRDIGTVVLPNAKLKIYLTASLEERAKRRFLELEAGGFSGDIEAITTEIAKRDEMDIKRDLSPLRPADDAVIVDTTSSTLDKVVNQIMDLIRNIEGEAHVPGSM